jgi:hypothetical protein
MTADSKSRRRAELDLAVLEDELVAAKSDKKTSPDKLRELKDKVRAARAEFRADRDSVATIRSNGKAG